MTFRVRYTRGARDDLVRLYGWPLERDVAAAECALAAVDEAVDVLGRFPFACRKADPANPWLRELLVSFGNAGYVLLYEIEDEHTLTILAVRHQREEDYY